MRTRHIEPWRRAGGRGISVTELALTLSVILGLLFVSLRIFTLTAAPVPPMAGTTACGATTGAEIPGDKNILCRTP